MIVEVRDIRSLGSEVTKSSELPSADAGNQILVLVLYKDGVY